MSSLRLLIAASAVLPLTAHAGAWTRQPGAGYLHLGMSTLLSGDGYFDEDGNRRNLLGASYVDRSMSLDGEFGVLERLTALAGITVWNVSLDYQPNDGRGGTSHTLPGQAGLGARYRFLDAPVLLAIQAEGRLALKRNEDPEPHRYGDGRDEARIVAIGSRSLGPAWLSLELGAKLRGERPANQVVYSAQAGRWFGPVGLQADLDGAQSLADADAQNPLLDTVVADAAHRFGLKAIGRPAPWLELDGGFQITYLGRSVASAPRFNAGLAVLF